MDKRTSTTYLLLLSLFALWAVLFSSCKNHENTQAPKVIALPVLTIKDASATTFQDYTAAIQGKTDVAIRPQVSGYLEQIYVDEGAYVTAGQPLFRIDEQPYRQQVNNAVANSHAADAAVTAAQLEVEKLEPLVENKVVSEVQLKTARAAYKMAVARAEQARAATGIARINMGYTTIKAPVSGYVGRLPYKKGSLVSNTDPTPLATLSDVKEVHAYFSMSETEFIRFRKQYTQDGKSAMPGATLMIADGSAYPEAGKVDMIDGQFDKTTGAITLRATFPNNDGILRSGNTGKIRIQQDYEHAILIPQQATTEMQDKLFVYILDSKNRVTKQLITVTGKAGTDYVLKSGIDKGSRIVSDGLDKLQEGMEVKPIDAGAAVTSK
ncbi:MAG: efflux RND transporter periplasmic adaptor subunit [Sphingobacteriales bacterium]|nr:MAG: efflux RND transporter periplasmic adaptor subunit [Sphingobacteriales bacterium]